MKHYSLLPEDWDYSHEKEILDYRKQGIHMVCDIEGVKDECGYIGCLTKTQAIDYAKQAKAKFPFVEFHLYTGRTFGTLEFVQSF